ncbi:uncharacterized PE-PGRS family protein PE_PGRS10-like isoform X2 [Malaya genurostris]|uniref:uncharacterized PE-PGRS family protein PE_PGRS10-like isoform X2 n=1 Tax=Malaya genurostris TaxID=325434 RepID=UPI0026F3CBD8|nr:uncharacterized PE-PGRS family protein PE_PGRS10-like isoform X2 [Malaya genurostris]
MKSVICILTLALLVVSISAHDEDEALKIRASDAAHEEILVESSLNVRKSNPAVRKHARSLMDLLMSPSHSRPKRQFGGFGASSSNANANAFNQQFGPQGFGASAANAGAQSFYNQGPLGGFGASAANSASQGFQGGPGGFSGSAGMSGSQSYHLPGNHDVSLSYTGGFSVANGKPSVSQGNSISFT